MPESSAASIALSGDGCGALLPLQATASHGALVVKAVQARTSGTRTAVACSGSSAPQPSPDGAMEAALDSGKDHGQHDSAGDQEQDQSADAVAEDGTEQLACEVFADGAPLLRDGSVIIIYPESGSCPDGDQPLV